VLALEAFRELLPPVHLPEIHDPWPPVCAADDFPGADEPRHATALGARSPFLGDGVEVGLLSVRDDVDGLVQIEHGGS
jgi:hypothetical protein